MITLKKAAQTISIAIITLAVMSCNTTPTNKNNDANKSNTDSSINAEVQNAPVDSIVPLLLDASANDFYQNQKPLPINFRNVQVKYLIKPNIGKQFVLCGEFLIKDEQSKEEWISFATIKNSAYEQWIGSNASAYCKDAKETSNQTKDLSAALAQKLDSIQKTKKIPAQIKP